MIPTNTLHRFIHARQREALDSSGELSDLLYSIALGVKIISQLIATAGFKGLYGYTGKTNIQGEATQVLDEEADEILVRLLGSSGHFGLLVSEERDTVVATEHSSKDVKYVVAFDPLDGSSNLGTNIPVGTIFGIFKKKSEGRAPNPSDFLQCGRNLVAAGYTVYGAKTSFVYTVGNGVHGFTLDPSIGEFILTDESMKMPKQGNIYSVNEGNAPFWDRHTSDYISALKNGGRDFKPYSARYVGSLVADFDRTLRRGGVYLYPSDNKNPQGKLRLLYECMPLAFIAEHAGGLAIDGKIPILDVLPESIHVRCPLIIGSAEEIERYLS